MVERTSSIPSCRGCHRAGRLSNLAFGPGGSFRSSSKGSVGLYPDSWRALTVTRLQDVVTCLDPTMVYFVLKDPKHKHQTTYIIKEPLTRGASHRAIAKNYTAPPFPTLPGLRGYFEPRHDGLSASMRVCLEVHG